MVEPLNFQRLLDELAEISQPEDGEAYLAKAVAAYAGLAAMAAAVPTTRLLQLERDIGAAVRLAMNGGLIPDEPLSVPASARRILREAGLPAPETVPAPALAL